MNERGAMMLIGLFFAICAVGILYSAIGVSQAALFRAHMQDGADASALSGAVMQARSMNLIVLLNIVMAALLSVLVALKLVEAITIAGIIIAGAVAIPTYGGSLALIPPLETIRDKVKTLHDQLEDPITKALEAVHDLSDLVAEVAPGAAEAVAQGTKRAPVESVYVGIGATLPVEDDEYKRLCRKAGEMPIALAEETLPFPKKGILKRAITNPLKKAMGALASTFSKWFCGDDSEDGDGGGPPSESINQVVWYPTDKGLDLCGEPPIGDGEDFDREHVEELTRQYADACSKRVERAYANGCDPSGPCTIDSPESALAESARVACQPGKSFMFHRYQLREGTVVYTWNGKRWVRGTPSMDDPKIVEIPLHPPCGPTGTVDQGYELSVRADRRSNIVTPVCSSEKPPSPFFYGEVGEEVEVSFKEVPHMLGCANSETIPVEVDVKQSEGSEDRSPKRVVSELSLGAEEFQVRTVVSGRPSGALSSESAVRLALWGHEAPDDGLDHLRLFSGFSTAQAEFFYDSAESKDKNKDKDARMWNMKWRARITRFRATEEQLSPLYESCQRHPTQQAAEAVGAEGLVLEGACTSFLNEVVRLGPLVTH